jgi:ABC-2 type transport system permease protein
VSDLTGTWAVVRLHLSRARGRIVAWLAGLVALVVVSGVSTKGLYPTAASLRAAAAVDASNAVALAFNGPAQALDTIGGQIAFQIGAFGFVVVGLMSLLMTSRFTRHEEESGRLELVRSMAIGRRAPLAAALVAMTAVEVVVGVAVATSLAVLDLPVAGSITFGLAYTCFGLVFVGVAAALAQVSENPRVVSGSAGAMLGLAFALRAVGDTGPTWLSWASPMGLAQRARPFAGERAWPLLLLGVTAMVSTAAGLNLAGRRDFGAGLFPPRPGPARGGHLLAGPLGLAVRLHRATVVWWCIATALLAAVYGGLTRSVEDFARDSPSMKDVIAGVGGHNLTDAFLATSMLVVALVATGAPLQIAIRLRAEEAAGRVEAILATPTPRRHWAASNLAVAFGGGLLALLLGGLALGTSAAVTGAGSGQVARLAAAGATYAPALWLVTAVAFGLFGFVPGATTGAWLGLAICFFLAMFGTLLRLPGWLLDVSPFHHTPALPAAPFAPLPLVLIGTVTIAVLAVGMTGLSRRSIPE